MEVKFLRFYLFPPTNPWPSIVRLKFRVLFGRHAWFKGRKRPFDYQLLLKSEPCPVGARKHPWLRLKYVPLGVLSSFTARTM